MFWHIGHFINEDLEYRKYSAYGDKIIATLSQRLTNHYGKGYTPVAADVPVVVCCVRFAI